MITRGIYRISTRPQVLDLEDIVLFDTLIQQWPPLGSSPPPITYANGVFTIPNASLSDYLICWTISIKTATALDHMSSFFLSKLTYSAGGFVTEGCSSYNSTTTGVVVGFKLLRVTLKVTQDRLQLRIINNNFGNTEYLAMPKPTSDNNLSGLTIANASIIILSL